LINKNKIPKYLTVLIKKNPKITAGRKNFQYQHDRIIKTVKIVRKYFNLKDNS